MSWFELFTQASLKQDVNDFKKLELTRQSLKYTIQTILSVLASIEKETERLKQIKIECEDHNSNHAEEQLQYVITEINIALEKYKQDSELYKQNLNTKLREMSLIVEFYDYCTEIRYAMRIIDEDLHSNIPQQKRTDLENSMQYFTKLLKEYEKFV